VLFIFSAYTVYVRPLHVKDQQPGVWSHINRHPLSHGK